jgi:hypothetical protein
MLEGVSALQGHFRTRSDNDVSVAKDGWQQEVYRRVDLLGRISTSCNDEQAYGDT